MMSGVFDDGIPEVHMLRRYHGPVQRPDGEFVRQLDFEQAAAHDRRRLALLQAAKRSSRCDEDPALEARRLVVNGERQSGARQFLDKTVTCALTELVDDYDVGSVPPDRCGDGCQTAATALADIPRQDFHADRGLSMPNASSHDEASARALSAAFSA